MIPQSQSPFRMIPLLLTQNYISAISTISTILICHLYLINCIVAVFSSRQTENKTEKQRVSGMTEVEKN